MGVSALYWSVLGGLARLDQPVDLTAFDAGSGLRDTVAEFDGEPFQYRLCGATGTRRVWQRRSFWNIRVSSWFGGLGNPAVRCLHGADAVLDITGGDSFTDLYGPRRFRVGSAFKRLVLGLGKPLILLPQTYGPFHDPRHREIAAEICRRATMAWARDERSFATLKDLLGDTFDPGRHFSGVDVTFSLEARRPSTPLPEPIATWLAAARSPATRSLGHWAPGKGPVPAFPHPLIGFNVSGLIWHDPAAMWQRYGFKADYREVVLGFLRRVLRDTDADIVLVPHVLTPPGHYESDPGANDAVLAALRDDPDARVARAARERAAAIPPVYYHPSEMKWIIAQCDWFCGTRMHACIAGLSSGVPTAAIAYSVKTQGVFETCGQGGHVADPRVAGTAEIVDRLWASWSDRTAVCAALAASAQANRQRAAQQMSAILTQVRPGAAAALGREVPA